MTRPHRIDPGLDVPLYQQLVDAIRSDIRMGVLPAGAQLPTVQQLASELGIARGTINRAYDQLEQLSLVEKVQGSGTFVRYQPANSSSRKEQAMAAIDTVLDQLETMGFSMAEIGIFLNLKLRQRAEQLSTVKVAVVECNPETLSQLSDQLRRIEQVEVCAYLLSSIQSYPYQLGEEIDLVVTTAEHAHYLESILPDRKKIARIAMRLSTPSVSAIVKLQAGDSLGILCSSPRFGALLYDTCQTYTERVDIALPQSLDGDWNCADFLRGKTAVLVPEELEKYASSQVLQQLLQFASHGQLIRCAYQLDEGSFLYLQEKIGRIREKKNI